MRGRKLLVALGVLAALTVPAASVDAAGKTKAPAKPSKPKYKTKIVIKKVARADSPVDVVSPPGNRKVNFILDAAAGSASCAKVASS